MPSAPRYGTGLVLQSGMLAAGKPVAGDAAIETWTIHCPDCGRPVTVRPEDEAVACTHCHAAFAPERLATAAYRKETAGEPRRDPDDELVGIWLGDWQLTRLIGRGGMGRVYEARDRKGRRRVALKVLSEDLASDPAFVKRFHREARVLASLSHPHVVEILDRGEANGRIWFAMEYVRGENLRRRLERAILPAEEAVRIAGEVASALAYAHARGVIHRDLKPENVLLDEEGRVHLVDFGLSRLAGDGGGGATSLLTRTDVILGTYEYMAPEQRRGDQDLDARADVFALGVILYEMLTGKLPLGRFAPPSRLRSDVPASLDTVVNHALATERDARFESAEALKAALDGAWARRGQAPQPPALPDARPAVRPPDRALLQEPQLVPLRRMLKHVDVLAALDRVLGVLLLLGALGIVSLGTLMGEYWPVKEVSFTVAILLFIAGILFLQQGGKLSRMREGSRDGQLTASVLLLFFPPFATAMGIYGLLVLTGDRARRAFAVGRKALEGPPPVVAARVVEVERPPHRAPPWVLLRLLFLAAVLWSLYAAFVAIETGKTTPDDTLANAWNLMSEPRQLALKISVAGVLVSLGAIVAAARVRARRRGLGIAFAAFVLFAVCATVLSNAHRVHALASVSVSQEVPWVLSHPPYPRLENRR